MYLTRAAVKATLDAVWSMSGPGSVIAHDMWHVVDDPGPMGTARRLAPSALSFIGEPVTFCIHPEDMDPFLAPSRFRITDLAHSRELQDRYARANGRSSTNPCTCSRPSGSTTERDGRYMNSIRRLEDHSSEELAVLVREYLMAGHMIDRAGMPHVMAELGRTRSAPSPSRSGWARGPVYTKRMQRALGFEGDSVETIFKGMQFDVGAPPQFLDFRFRLQDHDHGEFWLDHCGALADVEPMGEDFVFTMCHDIEDPTFDRHGDCHQPSSAGPSCAPATAGACRSAPVCQWTVVISDDHEPLPVPREAEAMWSTRAARLDLDPIDPAEPGLSDYHGSLLSDIRLEDWSHSAARTDRARDLPARPSARTLVPRRARTANGP